MILISRDRHGYISDETLEEFNAKCIITSFLEPNIDKETFHCSDGTKLYKTFSSKHKISYCRIIRLNNYRAIDKEFQI